MEMPGGVGASFQPTGMIRSPPLVVRARTHTDRRNVRSVILLIDDRWAENGESESRNRPANERHGREPGSLPGVLVHMTGGWEGICRLAEERSPISVKSIPPTGSTTLKGERSPIK